MSILAPDHMTSAGGREGRLAIRPSGTTPSGSVGRSVGSGSQPATGGTGFRNECIGRSVPRSRTRAQEAEILIVPKLPGVMSSGCVQVPTASRSEFGVGRGDLDRVACARTGVFRRLSGGPRP